CGGACPGHRRDRIGLCRPGVTAVRNRTGQVRSRPGPTTTTTTIAVAPRPAIAQTARETVAGALVRAAVTRAERSGWAAREAGHRRPSATRVARAIAPSTAAAVGAPVTSCRRRSTAVMVMDALWKITTSHNTAAPGGVAPR